MSSTAAKSGALPGYEILRFTAISLPPGMMHDNGDRSDPLDPIAQKVTGLRDGTPPKKRTMEYHKALAQLGFIGALWSTEIPEIIEDKQGSINRVEGGGVLAIPGNAFNSMMIAALGRQGKGRRDDARIALVCDQYYPLMIEGSLMTPQEAFELFNKMAVRVRIRNKSGQWVTATRPLFPSWSCEFQIQFQKKLFDREKVAQALEYAGEVLGLGTCRSRQYGRFEVQFA